MNYTLLARLHDEMKACYNAYQITNDPAFLAEAESLQLTILSLRS